MTTHAKLILKPGRAKPLWHGHPWIFRQAVDRIDRASDNDDLVEVFDPQQRWIGKAFLEGTSSAIAARMVTRSAVEIDAEFFRTRLESALWLRKQLGLPSEKTDCYRWINSEADGLPGLVIDVYARAVAIQCASVAMQARVEMVISLVEKLLQPESIVLVKPGRYAAQEGSESLARVVCGTGETICCEHHIAYHVNLIDGQKTGFFLDQRDNRDLVATISRGKRVLDLYCYTGGFALNAARGGASQVIAVDSSGRAIAHAMRNATQNQLAITAYEDDAMRYLKRCDPASFDLIILDPPSFAHQRRHRDDALKAYTQLQRYALRALDRRGFLCVASCSHAIDQQALELSASAAAKEEQRILTQLYARGASADHPTLPMFPEGAYLCFMMYAVAER